MSHVEDSMLCVTVCSCVARAIADFGNAIKKIEIESVVVVVCALNLWNYIADTWTELRFKSEQNINRSFQLVRQWVWRRTVVASVCITCSLRVRGHRGVNIFNPEWTFVSLWHFHDVNGIWNKKRKHNYDNNIWHKWQRSLLLACCRREEICSISMCALHGG